MALFVFGLGLCIGSFLNVVIYRLPEGRQVIFGRSFCPKCKRKILWYDNIPLLSFFILGRRCRYCKKPISWRYPLVEFLTGLLFIFGYLSHLSSLSFLFIAGLIVIFFVDLDYQIIPDQIVFPLLVGTLVYYLIKNYKLSLITNYLPTGLGLGAFFYFLHKITKGKGMGLGDVKLAFLIGIFFGFPLAILALYLAFLTGAFVGVILILSRKVKFGQQIAFGPFLAFGTILTLFFQDKFLWFLEKYF